MCTVCQATRDSHHDADPANCTCRRCQHPVHDFMPVADRPATAHQCTRCGATEPHALCDAGQRWIDDGGWDEVGPWSEQLYHVRDCAGCGYEDTEPTGQIRL